MPSEHLESAVVDLTRALIGIDSVNPRLVPGTVGEAAIAAHLADRLDGAGYAVRLVEAPSDPARVSVVAVRVGSRPGRTVVLNGHLDTVGVEDMPEPFTARIDGDRLIGRGASDMKGGVAGIVVAAESLAAADAPGTVIVALVADEEDASLGAESVLKHLAGREIAPDVCLIAEPTWLDLAIAHRGFAVVEIVLQGRAAHSSQPAEGLDVIGPVGDLLASIRAADRDLRDVIPHQLVGHGSLMTTVLRAGTAPFTVASGAELVVERRTVPGETAESALDDVSALVDAVTARTPGLRAEVRLGVARSAWQADASGAAAELAGALSSAIAQTGRRAESVGAPYWMESALWQEAGVPTVVCGPAGGGLHAIDEWVDLDQLRRFPAAVGAAVSRFLTA
ncbi:M20/M25/M40 family metallo-hydrolase [Agromyces aerolatus]|uniref:M20/M25/M40 family metallo-hydrolase n=1 Tax=Agromyces sp. LY-1074 TaxID=3074080 RepID=UPI0028542D13|nr:MULTISPECIES: M20/M25/M40 family metallo-hydrolase [unclassified Agromyces]MDR5698944.1 M20/M25/M40 family metallo-hydrolase [Agromyces sp. LY-1074]MDR5705278.1 M20/M25/M40 family metallo-hydrolase [Agromyces sp. LY-1358]